MTYTLLVSKSVQKQISQLPKSVKSRAIEKIKNLASDPRPSGCIKLKGHDNQYRVRVGDYRIRYDIDDKALSIKILQCKHRRDVYKNRLHTGIYFRKTVSKRLQLFS
ncbi:MAG: type II toxin-antitoxin system RelE/ParE family toxin [Cyanobacteria bacterium P01_F01_bin.150]